MSLSTSPQVASIGTSAANSTSGEFIIQGSGSGISITKTNNTLTVGIDSTVATLTGSQTLTNKTLTSPVLGGLPTSSISAAVSAAGTTQGTGTALTSAINNITTVAANTGVVLPTAVPGMVIIIRNGGANALNVYPASGAVVNALATNAALNLAVGSMTQFVAMSTTQWYTMTAIYG